MKSMTGGEFAKALERKASPHKIASGIRMVL